MDRFVAPCVLALAIAAACQGAAAQTVGNLKPLGAPPVPAENPLTEAKVLLGKALFWDEQLSRTGTVACGTCHRPMWSGTDPRAALAPKTSTNPGSNHRFGDADDVIGAAGVPLHDRDGNYLESGAFGFGAQVGGLRRGEADRLPAVVGGLAEGRDERVEVPRGQLHRARDVAARAQHRILLGQAQIIVKADRRRQRLRDPVGERVRRRLGRDDRHRQPRHPPPQRDGGQAQYIQAPPEHERVSSLAGVTTWMVEHLAEDQPIAELARDDAVFRVDRLVITPKER